MDTRREAANLRLGTCDLQQLFSASVLDRVIMPDSQVSSFWLLVTVLIPYSE